MAGDAYAVRLADDGPAAWTNAGSYSATRDDPLVTGLDRDTADRLVTNHPFVHADVSMDTESAEDDAADEDSANTSSDASGGEEAADTDADAQNAGDSYSDAVASVLETYDDDSVSEFVDAAENANLSADEVETLRDYESEHKDRSTALEGLDDLFNGE